MNTQIFFLEQLVNEIKEDNNEESEQEEIIPEFEHTGKLKLEDIINDLPNIIHKEFDYFDYSEKDNSNERFLRKQENTNNLRDNIFVTNNNEENKEKKQKKDLSLDIDFKENNNNLPF